MYKFLVSVLLVSSALCTEAHAGAAVSYSCVGKNALTKEAVVFDLMFSDHAWEEGYTNQSITVTKVGFEYLKGPLVFQMYNATKKNECQKNNLGEVYLAGHNFEMTPTAEGEKIAAYIVTFKSACANQPQFDVQAYCLFEY